MTSLRPSSDVPSVFIPQATRAATRQDFVEIARAKERGQHHRLRPSPPSFSRIRCLVFPVGVRSEPSQLPTEVVAQVIPPPSSPQITIKESFLMDQNGSEA